MARARPWYKRRGGTFVTATMHVPPIPRLCYSLIIDMLNDRDAPLPDNAAFIAGFCGISKQAWTSARKWLLDDGKLILVGDGYISNPVFEEERAERMTERERAVEFGRQGGQKSAAIRTAQQPEFDLPPQEVGEKLEETSEKHGNFSQSFTRPENEKPQKTAPEIQPPPQPIRAREESRVQSIEPTDQAAARAHTPARDSENLDESQLKTAPDILKAISTITGFYPSSPEAVAKAHGYVERWQSLGVDFAGMALPLMSKMIANSNEAVTSSLARFDRAIIAQNAKDKAKARPPAKPKARPAPPAIFEFDDEPPAAVAFRKSLLRMIGPHAYARYNEQSVQHKTRNIKIRIGEHANGKGDVVSIDGPLSNELKEQAGMLNLRKSAQALGFVDCF